MKRIAELRKEKHWSQMKLALKLNVSQKMISAYENGTHQPSIDTLIKMANIFNVSVDYIIGNTNIKTPIDNLVKDYFSHNEIELLNIYKDLDINKQKKAIGILFALKYYNDI